MPSRHGEPSSFRAALDTRSGYGVPMRRLAPLALVLALAGCSSDVTTTDVEDAVREQVVDRINRPDTELTLVDVECDPLASSDVGTKVQCDATVRNEDGEPVPVPVRATILDDGISVEPVR